MKTKKTFKMPTSYTILYAIIVIVAILTWIVPAGQYQMTEMNGQNIPVAGTYERIENTPQGIFEVLGAPVKGFYDGLQVSFFIMMIGGFLGVVMKTGAIDAGITAITKTFKGREKIMLVILTSLFALGGSTFGMAEETIAFYPLIIPILIAAGYDTVTAVSVILLGAGLGCLASTVNPFATGIASGFAGVAIGEGLFLRMAMFAVGLVITILFILLYAQKVKADPTKSIVYDTWKQDKEHFLGTAHGAEFPEMTKKRSLALVIFCASFIFMIFSLIPFSDLGITFIPTLGWYFQELSVFFLTMGIVLGIVAGLKEEELVTAFIDGMKDLFGVAIVVGVSRGITIIMNDGNITATVLNMGETTLASLGRISFIVLTYVFYIPMSFLIPSSSGLATLSMPIMAPMADFAGVARSMVITAYQSASGLVNFITPTSGVVMGGLAIARVPYDKWLKFSLKYLAIIFAYTIVFLIIGVWV